MGRCQPNEITSLALFLSLASKNIAIAEKSLAFSNRKVQNRKFYCKNRQKNRRKKSQKNRCDFWGCGIKIAAFLRFQNRSVFGTLSS